MRLIVLLLTLLNHADNHHRLQTANRMLLGDEDYESELHLPAFRLVINTLHLHLLVFAPSWCSDPPKRTSCRFGDRGTSSQSCVLFEI